MDQETQWIKKIQKNADKEAANQLVSMYYKEMYAFVYKQLLDEELSLDVTQELFISVLKTIHHFDHRKAAFRTWLYRVASNRIVDYYRSKSYRYRKISESIEGHDFEAEEDMSISMEYKEDMKRAAEIINQLETSSQQIVRLKLFGEYSLQEITAIVQVPLSTVKTRYYAALKRIKKEMKEHQYE